MAGFGRKVSRPRRLMSGKASSEFRSGTTWGLSPSALSLREPGGACNYLRWLLSLLGVCSLLWFWTP